MCEDERRKNVRKPQVILRRIRSGQGYGSGSGSVIWERRKRNGMWLKTISKRTIRLHSGIRFAINATPHSFKSFQQQITPSHRRHIPARHERSLKQGRFSTLIRLEVPTAKCRISKRDEGGSFISKTESFPSREIFYHFLWKESYDSTEKFPLLPSLRNSAFAGVPSGLSKTRKQRSAFRKPFRACVGVTEVTSE